ncbi:penicillin-binding protein activator LpoB [Parasediminibacterium sp. JCM 36343]|uniref:penicillin-binding protein activator LpoB n=1 Tax=Parasediminibacterium sp. JCM 36343 TaxID=3374279 RepID=UPI003978F7E3
MKINFPLAASIILCLAINSCANRKVTRVDPSEQIDLSGSWNNTDSRMVSDEMVNQILGDRWLNDHTAAKGKKPVVIVGLVTNKSHEHIEAEPFINDLERACLKSSRIGLVQSGKKREELRAEKADQQTNASQSSLKKFGLENGADYILQGSINSIVDAYKKQKAVTYQVNLELTNIETNEIVWVGDKKISKYIKN